MNADASEWRRLDSAEEIEALLEFCADFHDNILRECKYQSALCHDHGGIGRRGVSHLRCFFQGARNGPLEIVFVDVKSFHVEPHPDDPFDQAGFELKGEQLTWSGENCWVKCKTAIWRPRPDWEGIRDRYSAVEPSDLEDYAFEDLPE